MEGIKRQIQFILKDFDFKKVYNATRALNFQWKDENGDKFNPTIDDLKNMARTCLLQAHNNENKIFQQYGFEAEEINGVLELKFVLERSNSLSLIFDKNPAHSHDSITRKGK